MSRITRLVLTLAVLAATTLTGAATAGAHPFPLPDDPGGAASTPAPAAAVGTPGWQVVAIAAAAALVAAGIAYLLGSRSVRRQLTYPPATRGSAAAPAA